MSCAQHTDAHNIQHGDEAPFGGFVAYRVHLAAGSRLLTLMLGSLRVMGTRGRWLFGQRHGTTPARDGIAAVAVNDKMENLLRFAFVGEIISAGVLLVGFFFVLPSL